MRTDEERREEAIEELMGRIEAGKFVVEKIARCFRDEGVRSYARPLEAASENLQDALSEFLWEFKHGDADSIEADTDAEAIDRLLDELDEGGES